MGRIRRTFSAQQKAKIALEALRERETLSEIAQKYQVHPSQVTLWKKQANDGLISVFEQANPSGKEGDDGKEALLYQQIGQLQFELDWLKKKITKL
jgi:transposase-like protein